MDLNERKLSDSEIKKRDEIVKAIKRDRKEENLTDEEVYAIATAQAKKTRTNEDLDPYERLVAIQEAKNRMTGADVGLAFNLQKAGFSRFPGSKGLVKSPAEAKRAKKRLKKKTPIKRKPNN